MKPQVTVQATLPVASTRWRPWWIRLVIVVALGSLLVFAPPANVTVLAQAGSPSDSYGCSGRYHRVKPGETLYSIAARYGSTAYRIRSCNGLSSSAVRVGQSLLIPIRSSSTGSWLEGIDFVKDAAPIAPVITLEMAYP